ncbi:hypothetical protein PV11_01556 [Exophiala sideris]|uniref:Uncharacterized protein n=1 Tax=Exophiala sideris TaxID=1016849 RepID=A0A0D1YWI1_9EURO|nr:hypothetical protein PV11_01556 [Exophiala sideris]
MSNNTGQNVGQTYDLDIEISFRECAERLRSPDTDNFAVRFNSAGAKCAVDVSLEKTLEWLESKRADNEVVWLNFWASTSQKATVAAIGKKYGLSQRLTGLLCPVGGSASLPTGTASDSTSDDTSTTVNGTAKDAHTTDVEKGVSMTSSHATQSNPKPSGLQGISFSDVVDDLWHFCSVDFGPKYIYVGYNALFSLSGGERKDDNTNKPDGVRIWTSLLIFDDGTVLSVFQKPITPEAHKVSRRNVLNVFQHLSTLYAQDDALGALMKVSVRWKEQSETSEKGHPESEAASLLFYYLFDDWWSTYMLIARREHPYRHTLETLRESMFEAANLELIKKVHDVGRQLTVLKLMYQSYELIVSRLLYRQQSARHSDLGSLAPMDQGRSHNVAGSDHESSTPATHLQRAQSELMYSDYGSGPRVKLSLSAVVRFERLLDRIKLYALTEIEECLKEKESLVFMNFNLVTLKESQAVERLTRTTILLAKATIIFLPVSLMTAYFSIQLPGHNSLNSIKTYWLCFLVVALLSIGFLFIFGITTHTVEGKTIYKSITRMVLDFFRFRSKRKKH